MTASPEIDGQEQVDWNRITSVKYTVNAPAGGTYRLTLGYGCGGSAGTYVYACVRVNGAPAGEWQELALTKGAWGNGRTDAFVDVKLQEGENMVWITGSLRGDGNWINYDYLDVQLRKADGKEEKKMGDVNGDGAVDSKDARLVLQYAVDAAELTQAQQKIADLNEDNTVDSKDACAILQAAVS